MKSWLPLEAFFVIAGLYLAALAVRIALDRKRPGRGAAALFWMLLAVSVGGGSWLPHWAVGAAVVTLAALAASGRTGALRIEKTDTETRLASMRRLGNRLLWPVFLVPALAVAGGFVWPAVAAGGLPIAEPRHAAQVALAVGCLAGLAYALRLTGEGSRTATAEGGRLLELIGWALILPQALAALGGVFAKAGVGDEVARLVAAALPMQHPLAAVVAYCAGMTLFTVLMGNAFAAFPVLTLGVGLPFIVRQHGGDPAIMGVFGLLCGYCGTLVTPMAANFNLVPVRLLELRDDTAVMRAQAPFAAAIWIFNVAAMALCVYRF